MRVPLRTPPVHRLGAILTCGRAGVLCAAVLASGLFLTGCNRALPPPDNQGTDEPSAPAAGTSYALGDANARNLPACSVQLWDGDDFTDESVIVRGPGKFRDLRHLPDADGKDWHHEADSLKTGLAASVKVWKQEDFQGRSQRYRPGSEHPDIDIEPGSVQITCK